MKARPRVAWRLGVARSAALLAATLAIVATPVLAQVRSGGDGLLYLATYEPSLYVLSERDLSVVDRIAMTSGVPSTVEALSLDRTRAYLLSIDYEKIEVVDLAERRSIDLFTLSERNMRVRIRGIAVHPDGRHAALTLRRYTKLRDRWEIGEPEFVLYDMAERRVARDLPWPDGRPSDNLSFGFSPDGTHLYVFMSDVRIYETGTYSEVGRWAHRDVVDEALENPNISFPMSYRDEPGWYSGLFQVREPIQDRSLLGFARANPTLRRVEHVILGPLETGPRNRVSFAITDDRTRGYGLHQEIDNYQIWSFDLVRGTGRHITFPGRPRMELEVSSNGELLYIYNAGNTIDVLDAVSLEHLRTVELDADMIRPMLVLPAPTARSARGPR